jgi:RNA polymerase sigma-70 factor (ECF subfamily)
LDPDVVLRSDFGPARLESALVRGAKAVANRARLGAAPASEIHPARVNGTAGAVITRSGEPFAIMAFTVADGRIIEIDIIGGGDRVRRVAAAVLPN